MIYLKGVGNSEEFSLIVYEEGMIEGEEEVKGTGTLTRGTLKKVNF